MPSQRDINRNDPCPCGSGRKYKRCCMGREPGDAPLEAPSGPNHRTLLRQARVHEDAGRLQQAAPLYERVLTLRPDEAGALYGLGRIRGAGGRRDEGIELLRRAVEIDDGRADHHAALADLLQQSGDRSAALTSAERAIALDPSHVAALCVAAYALDRMNRLDEAEAHLRRALGRAPGDANARTLLARVQRRRGQPAEATEILERVLAEPTLTPALARRVWHELGVCRDKLGDYDGAFEALTRGGELAAESPAARRIDAGLVIRRLERDRRDLTPALLGRWQPADVAVDGPTPVFLVGFPRSGTTMTEQVLAAHPQVVTSDETPLVGRLRETLAVRSGGKTDDLPGLLDRAPRELLDDLRTLYRTEAQALLGEPVGARVYVDKLPLNLTEIGLINAVFPDARVIVCLRDPRDVCVSCFLQDFQLNVAMIHFLSIERACVFYAAVMDLYLAVRAHLTVPTLEIRYEDTVSDLEPQARRMLTFLGLPWDDGVLAFHERARQRLIKTPSFAAVTEPVHRRAVGRWRNYETHIRPHVPMLRRYLDTFGYD